MLLIEGRMMRVLMLALDRYLFTSGSGGEALILLSLKMGGFLFMRPFSLLLDVYFFWLAAGLSQPK